MNRSLFLLFIALLGVSEPLGQAQETAPATPAPQGTPAQTGEAAAPAAAPKPPPYELKNKSTFDVAAGTRAPFIPIGWVKPVGPAVVAVKTTIDEGSFRLTSVLLGNPSLAVINGRSYEEGQILRMPRSAGPQPVVRVYRIGDGQVWLQHEGRIFNVPLKRNELNDRRTETPLLNEERDIVPQQQQLQQAVPAPAPGGATAVPLPR